MLLRAFLIEPHLLDDRDCCYWRSAEWRRRVDL
jgi:hypothetical protein